MNTRNSTLFTVTGGLPIGRPFAIAALCLSMASNVLSEQHSARSQHKAAAPLRKKSPCWWLRAKRPRGHDAARPSAGQRRA